MIQQKKIREAPMIAPIFSDAQNDPACEGCRYYAPLCSGAAQMACHYILVEKHRRPCDPGKDCTVKKLGEYPGYDSGSWCNDGRGKEDEDADP